MGMQTREMRGVNWGRGREDGEEENARGTAGAARRRAAGDGEGRW